MRPIKFRRNFRSKPKRCCTKSIRLANVIESTLATIRRRSKQTNGHASRDAAIAMMFALATHAEKTWRKIDSFNHIANVLDGVVYTDGELKMVA